MNALQILYESKWAITPMALEIMVEMAARNADLTPEVIAKAMHGTIWERYLDAQGNISDFWALEAVNYPLLEGTRRVSLADNVAILPVVGPIFPRANLMTMSGGASVQSLAYDFKTALESNAVDSIILNIDSPGGQLTGIQEFADMIFAANEKKPVISYIYGMGASAAYCLAAAGSEIVISKSGDAGSIGIVAIYSSNKRERDKKGIDEFEIVSSQSPNKRPDPGTEQGRAQIQATVDAAAEVFIGSIAKYRGVTAEDVLSKYGQGGMFLGEQAITNGLADRIGSLEMLISEQQKLKTSTTFFMGGPMTLQELQASHPQVYAEAVAIGRKQAESEAGTKIADAKQTGFTEGIQAENKRIQSIEAIKAVGAADVIAANKFNTEMTADKVSSLILAKQKEQLDKMGADAMADGKALAGLASGVGTGAPPDGDSDDKAVLSGMISGIKEYNSRHAKKE